MIDMHSTLADDELAARAQNGCQDSWTELDRRYRNAYIRLVRLYYGLDYSDGEDIYQKGFPKAVNNFERGRGNFTSYLKTILRREALDSIKSKKPQESIEGTSLASENTDIALLELNQIQEEARRRITEILSPLTPEEQKAFYLHYVEGYSWEEVGSLLGRSHDSLRSGISRKISKIRRALTSQATTFRDKIARLSTLTDLIGAKPSADAKPRSSHEE